MNNETYVRHILVIDDNQSIHEDFKKILATTRTASSRIDEFESAFFGSAPAAAEAQTKFEIDSAFQGQDGLKLFAPTTTG